MENQALARPDLPDMPPAFRPSATQPPAADGGARWAMWAVGALVALVYLAAADKYGLFRNELYFIICGRHPAFGYVDQPPLVPLLAAFTQLAGVHVWAARIPGILASVALVPLTVLFAQLLGASTRAAWLAAVAAATSTLIIAMTAALSTSTFEPIDFTAVGYLIALGIRRNQPRAFWWAGAVAGIAFETKYGILLWGAGLVLGLLLAGPRSLLRSRDFWIGAAIAAVIALPNVIWQIAHGLPFLELVRNDNSGNFTGTPAGFVLGQIFMVNPALAPLWIAGIVAPFVSKRMAPARFLSIAFLVTAALVYATHGKSYYLAGAYPAMFAVGAAASTRLWRTIIALWAALAAFNAAMALPFVLPVVPPAKLQAMVAKFAMPPIERVCIGAPLGCVFSGEFGWPQLAQTVESAYNALPPAQRAATAIYASNYGTAAAIDVYGSGLPPAISANNQYYLWGTRGYDGSSVIAVNVNPAKWAGMCDSARVIAYTPDSPYAMPYDRHQPIVLCRGMHGGLAQTWPSLKHYGVENLGDPVR